MSDVKVIYVITGDDRGSSKLRTYKVLSETDKKYICRAKKFTKAKDGDCIGSHMDWSAWSSDKDAVDKLRIDLVGLTIQRNEQMIEWIPYQLDRDYGFFITEGHEDPNQEIYNKVSKIANKQVEKLQNINKRVRRQIKLLKGDELDG